MPKIKLDLSILILFVLGLIYQSIMQIMIFIVIIIAHELGHFLMIKFTKGHISSIKIGIFGGLIEGYQDDHNVLKNILVDFGRHLDKCFNYNLHKNIC